jgi:hypothetical protein
MNLSFTQKINGQPNFFIEKIWEGIFRNDLVENPSDLQNEFIEAHQRKLGCDWDFFPESHTRLEYPKIHTIREDLHNRWRAGMNVHFVINNRTNKVFRFAPVLPCVSVQDIRLSTERKGIATITKVLIDGNCIGEIVWLNCQLLSWSITVEILAKQDGFDNVNDFFEYFPEDYVGKIIHWTGYKYKMDQFMKLGKKFKVNVFHEFDDTNLSYESMSKLMKEFDKKGRNNLPANDKSEK